MDLTNLVTGLLILLAGRKLFWLFIGIVGFLAGMHFGLEFFASLNRPLLLLFSFCIGIFGAFLALGFQGLAIILAGFLGGGYFLISMFTFIGLQAESSWQIFLIGGLCGALIVALTFDWALIGLTSLIGAMMIVEGLSIKEPVRTVFFIACAAIGIIAQAHLLRKPGT